MDAGGRSRRFRVFETFLQGPALPLRQRKTGRIVAKQQPEFLDCERASDRVLAPDPQRRARADAITAGLDYLLDRHCRRRWSTTDLSSDSLSTACVVVRLRDVLPVHNSHRLRVKLNESLDWLTEVQNPWGSWPGRSGQDDARATAWAILAFERSGRSAPNSASDWLSGCRSGDGGFAAGRETPVGCLKTTALAVHALGHIDRDAEGFLCAGLQSGAAHPAEQLSTCAAILDCDKSLVPLPLLNLACQVTARAQEEGVADLALLLRCLLRLRLTRAGMLADRLRAMQRADGSWPGAHGDSLVATASAVSTLVLVDSQPGLYFGSDLPKPRRWRGLSQG